VRLLRLASFAVFALLVALLGVLPVGIAYIYMGALLDRPCADHPEPLSQRLSNAEGFTFSPVAGVTLDAWLVTGDNGAGVIILPGAWGGANSMWQEMEMLHQRGYTVMTYDTRSCANPPQRTTLGYAEIADLQAALDILSARPGVERIGVFGFSMGGATAIMTAARDERIVAVAVAGNYADLAQDVRRNVTEQNWLERWIRLWIEQFYEWKTGVNIDNARPLAVIGQISPRPLLLIHGEKELGETRGAAQFAAAGEPKSLWIVEGAGHGEYARQYDAYRQHIITFFDTNLGYDD